MSQTIIHGTPISTYVRSVRMTLQEKGQAYELRDVDILKGQHRTPEFLKLHPFGKVPAVQFGDTVIYETAAILQYIDETVPTPALMPSSALGRARVRQIMAVVDSYAYPAIIPPIVIQRLVVPSLGGTPDLEMIAEATPKANTAVAALEALAEGGDFLIGGALSLADIYLAPVFGYFSMTPEFAGATQAAPKLTQWWAALSQRPSFKTATS